MKSYDAVIIGGGMVGATLACALARIPLKTALVETAAPAAFDPDSDYDLRVSAISTASRRLFERLGIWPTIAAGRINPYREMHVWDAAGQGLLHFNSADLGLPELGHIIENCVIQAAVWNSLENVDILCPARLAQLQLDEQGVRVQLEDGREFGASLVIGADGAESRVRTQAGITTGGWTYDQRGLVCTVATEQPHQSTAWQRFLPTGPLAFLPLADGRCSIVWSATSELAETLLKLGASAFAARLTAASGSMLGGITAVGPRAAFPLKLQHAHEYVRPGLALVGDAAHVIHPLAGQGVNLGLLDVAALAQVLADAKSEDRGFGDLRVLQRYERWRRGDNLVMMAATDGLKRLFGSANPLLKFVRNHGMGVVNGLTPVRNLLIRHAMGLEGDLPPLVRAGQ